MNTRILPTSMALVAALLTGCVRGNVSSTNGDISMAPPSTGIAEPVPVPSPVPDPPAPAPAPAPVPTPTPVPVPVPTPPPPAPAPVLPPLSPTVIDLTNNPRVGVPHWRDRDPATMPHGETIDGLECYPGIDPPTTYHVHAHLSIYLDNVSLSIPEDVGVVKLTPTTQCVYSLHTHNHSGKLHIEGPAPVTFTLGQFFDIWGQPLQADNVAGLTGKPVVVYVTDHNGVVTEVTGNWRDIELISHREITIQVGETLTEIPNYDWPNH